MEKILLAIDSQNLDENAVNFACYVTRLTGSKLTAIFLDNLVSEEEVTINVGGDVPYVESTIIREGVGDRARAVTRDQNISLFQQLTEAAGIDADIYRNTGVPAFDILAESKFADILILDANSFCGAYDGPPTRFVKDILQDAGCPVVMAPETFEDIDNVVFCYDGGKSSLFAMKQFSYLFPELKLRKAQVINLKGEAPTSDEVSGVSEWLKIHFSDVEWLLPEEEATLALFNYLQQKKNDFLVMGAYGRGLLASFFENEPEEGTARTTSLPIFVTHY
ncbi:MAG TPA: universal stress protein [Puia sp.]|nr:universal stress protein [Puia sp.]